MTTAEGVRRRDSGDACPRHYDHVLFYFVWLVWVVLSSELYRSCAAPALAPRRPAPDTSPIRLASYSDIIIVL